MNNLLSKISFCLIVASVLLLQGCALQVTRGSASVEVNTGIINAKAEIEFERSEEGNSDSQFAKINVLGKSVQSADSIDLYLDLYASNAVIPDQQGAVTISIMQDGSLVSAATFVASVQNGLVLADNPDQVDTWLATHDHLSHGTVAFDVNNVTYSAEPGSTFEITNNLMVNSDLLASATALGFEPQYCEGLLCIQEP